MAHNGTTHTLNTGAKIPALGFGTWQDKDAQEPGELRKADPRTFQFV